MITARPIRRHDHKPAWRVRDQHDDTPFSDLPEVRGNRPSEAAEAWAKQYAEIDFSDPEELVVDVIDYPLMTTITRIAISPDLKPVYHTTVLETTAANA